MAEFEETQPEETKTEAPTRLETLKMSLTEYAESTKSYTTEKYEKTKTLVNETVVEPYARRRLAGEACESAYADGAVVLKIKAALGSRDKAPEPVTAEAVEEPVAV
ncbi:hypothetical protein JL720_10370 [Aureococcus anophagefferens]|nr:hypothetical protein JL720_10370 [Aureococcus anophagefferens]